MDHTKPEELDPREVDRPNETPAWEEIEAGRFQPRRIRGSYPGRTLG